MVEMLFLISIKRENSFSIKMASIQNFSMSKTVENIIFEPKQGKIRNNI